MSCCEPEGSAVDELRLRPCRRIDQIQVTGRTVTGRKQKTGGPNGQDIFGDDEVTDVGQSLLVVTTGRRRDCLRGRCAGGRLRDVRVLSDDGGCDGANEKNDGSKDPTLQCNHAAPAFCASSATMLSNASSTGESSNYLHSASLSIQEHGCSRWRDAGGSR